MLEHNQFKLHPSVMYSIIREQAGSPEKSLIELVMNSIDAGATKIELDISAHGFSIKDNGLGFKSLDEIENFFGTFGTPHQKGDAVFGQFRIGRGQCFAIAKTKWRSGLFGMDVDLGGVGKKDVHGYELHEFNEKYEGCLIEGEFYQKLNIHEEVQSPLVFDTLFAESIDKYKKNPFGTVFGLEGFFSRLVRSLCMLQVETYLNGVKVSDMLESMVKIGSDSNASYYALDKVRNCGLILLNKGIYIATLPYSFGSIIDFKISPELNMARNQINANCSIYKKALAQHHNLLIESFNNGEVWAKSLGSILAQNLVNTHNQYDGELVNSFTTKTFEGFLKSYKVVAITSQKHTQISLLDALNKASEINVYLNQSFQNEELKTTHIKGLVSVLSEQNIEGMLIVDKTSLLVVSEKIDKELRSLTGCLISRCNSYGLSDLVKNLKTHDFYSCVDEIDCEEIYKTKIKKTLIKPPKNESSIIQTKKLLEDYRVNFSVTNGWLNKNEKALTLLETRIGEFCEHFKDLIIEVTGKLPNTLHLAKQKPIIPIIVDSLYNRTNLTKMILVDKQLYLMITKKAFQNGEWIQVLTDHLLSCKKQNANEAFDLHDFNSKFHDGLNEVDLSDWFDNLESIAIDVSQSLLKSIIRDNQKRPMIEMKSAWSEVFKEKPSLLNNPDLDDKWRKFNSISLN